MLTFTKPSFCEISPWTHSKITHLYITIKIKIILCITGFMPKIVWNWCLKFILSRVLQRWEDWHAVNLKVFSPSKRKGLLQYTVYNEVSAFNSEVGLLWESVYWLKMTTGQVVETSVTVNWNCEQSYSGLHSLWRSYSTYL